MIIAADSDFQISDVNEVSSPGAGIDTCRKVVS
jgi:hypothetical protein